jgi:hypothetical protein
MFQPRISPIDRIVATSIFTTDISAFHEGIHQMFSAEQYRAKAAEYREMITNIPRSTNDTNEFRNLEQTYTTLAENEEWMAINVDRTIHRRKDRDSRNDLDEDEERILRCVAMAAVMRQGTVFTKLQQGLVDQANLSISPHATASTIVATEQVQVPFNLPTDENSNVVA